VAKTKAYEKLLQARVPAKLDKAIKDKAKKGQITVAAQIRRDLMTYYGFMSPSDGDTRKDDGS